MPALGSRSTFPRLLAAFVLTLTGLIALGLALAVQAEAQPGPWFR